MSNSISSNPISTNPISANPISAQSQTSPAIEQATILVVDDNPTNIKVLCDFLSDCSYRIAVAQSGEKALEKVSRISPDLILLDVMMPGIDGFETCRQLKANPRTQDIPILFMTALSDTLNKVKGLSLGAVDYITKPIEYEETLARIKVHLALRKAQTRLVQEEKMAALGQLVAGVAHEINNPINFIQGNLIPAQEYAEFLMELIRLHESHPSPSPAAIAYAEAIDLNFIRQDFISLLRSMSMGTERIQKIVQSLRTFSRLDESDQKAVNLHECIESTLIILESRIRGKGGKGERPAIQVIRDYGSLPLILCYPGKLNQVFMNLIVNAIDAIDEKFAALLNQDSSLSGVSSGVASGLPSGGEPFDLPTLRISTALTQNQAIIRIVDSGMGIPRDIQRKIFDQFFTTKPIGQGTGLGLAISRTIVTEDHGGSLTFQSQAGEGTEFTIALPAHL
jgi:two-component system, NtrC family, sensor kinase